MKKIYKILLSIATCFVLYAMKIGIKSVIRTGSMIFGIKSAFSSMLSMLYMGGVFLVLPQWFGIKLIMLWLLFNNLVSRPFRFLSQMFLQRKDKVPLKESDKEPTKEVNNLVRAEKAYLVTKGSFNAIGALIGLVCILQSRNILYSLRSLGGPSSVVEDFIYRDIIFIFCVLTIWSLFTAYKCFKTTYALMNVQRDEVPLIQEEI